VQASLFPDPPATIAPHRVCRYCSIMRAPRPRGLCFTCYKNVTIRIQVSPLSKHGRRGLCYQRKKSTLTLGHPTAHLPGSPGKIETLRARVAAGEELFHPLDAGPRNARWLNED